MTVEKILTLIALLSGFLSSVWFIKGTVSLNGETINLLSRTYWDQNPCLEESFARQRAEYILGALFLCLSFSVQLAIHLIPLKFLLSCPLSLENSISCVLDIFFALLLLSWWIYRLQKAKIETEIIIAQQKEDEIYKELQEESYP